jgi:hypothetical protein
MNSDNNIAGSGGIDARPLFPASNELASLLVECALYPAGPIGNAEVWIGIDEDIFGVAG